MNLWERLDLALPPFLLPGLLVSLGSLGWLYWKGLRRGRWLGILFIPPVLWLAAVVLATLSLWIPALSAAGLAFAGSSLLAALLAWHSQNQRADLARMRQIVEVRSDRVNALSHEVRTPLTMIKGAADLLLEGRPGPLTPQQLTFLQTISQNCEQMISLAEDLLTQARIDAGLFKLRLEMVDLRTLVKNSVYSFRRIVAHRQQTIKLDYPQVSEHSYADPRLIQQVLANLLQNASRHTTLGGHIYVSLSYNDQAAVVTVTDDGAGMSPEERQRLFQKFASGRPLGDGTGLGLVITRQIIELHRGQILLDTTLGRGTTVLFSLPRWRDDDGQTSGSNRR